MMLLQASEIREYEGKYPSQIVLRQVTPSTYATHIKVLPPNAEPYFVLGHYFFKREEARRTSRNVSWNSRVRKAARNHEPSCHSGSTLYFITARAGPVSSQPM